MPHQLTVVENVAKRSRAVTFSNGMKRAMRDGTKRARRKRVRMNRLSVGNLPRMSQLEVQLLLPALLGPRSTIQTPR